MRTIPLQRARRIALGAQGFARARPAGAIDVRHLRATLERNHVVQLDSVNVVTRAHELPFFSRLGPYDRTRLHDWLWCSRENVEYWAHEASVVPMGLRPLFRHRMRTQTPWRRMQQLLEERPRYLDEVRAAVLERGPVTAGELAEPGERGASWWGWTPARAALHHLYLSGELAVAHRDAQFTIHYDLSERVIPDHVLSTPEPAQPEARHALLLLAARAHGIGTATDLADHFRMPIRETRADLAALAAAGALEVVQVPGWPGPVYLHPDARVPRSVQARALLAPFDPLVWFRERAERLFDFRYRIEIYVPKDRRVHGYYVLPFLLDDALVARVDLKADRAAGQLEVRAAHLEPGQDRVRVARELAEELRLMARWLDLGAVVAVDRGDLAPALSRHL